MGGQYCEDRVVIRYADNRLCPLAARHVRGRGFLLRRVRERMRYGRVLRLVAMEKIQNRCRNGHVFLLDEHRSRADVVNARGGHRINTPQSCVPARLQEENQRDQQ
jgi:hypothetical protein